MDLLFTTKNGIQLYGTIKNDEIISLHSTDAAAIVAALKEDLYSRDSFAGYAAMVLLSTIKRLGVDPIEG